MTKNDCVKNNSTGYCKTDTNGRKVSRSQLAYSRAAYIMNLASGQFLS